MKTTNFLFAFLFVTATLSSCSKERVEQLKETQISEYESINNYFDSKKQDEQEFIIDTSGTGPVTGNQGTKIWASKEKLMYPNGDSVQWPYTIKLIELYTAKDMIYYQMPNISSGALLTTAGEVRIRAFKDGQELVLRPSETWSVEMPAASPLTGMSIYYGTPGGGFVDWTPNPAGVFYTTAYGYAGEIHTLGWVLCGKAAAVSATTTHYTFTSATDNLQNVSTFVYFTDTRCLMQVYGQYSGAMPVGENIKIILIGINSSNQLFHYYSETQVSTSNQVDITLTQISDQDLTAILNAF
jgi:hypothetical protein